MKRSKMFWGIFVVVTLLQLAAPVSLIWRYEYTLRTGRAYRFRTAPVDPYDAFRGRYVALQFEQATAPVRHKQPVAYGQRVYAIIEKGQDGFAQFKEATTVRPSTGDYLHVPAGWMDTHNNTVPLVLPFDRFYMEETTAPQAEQAYREHSRRSQQDTYVIVRVRNGRGVIENLYIGDVPMADFVREQRSQP